MRTKEFLSARGVDFESINVAEDVGGLEALRSLGARGVPIVAKGDDFIYSQDLNELARFVGLDYHVEPTLSPEELTARLGRIIDIARISVQQIPEEHLQDKLPGRDRTLITLANHLFEIVSAFVQVARGADFTGALAQAIPEKELAPEELNERALTIKADLNEWWQGLEDRNCTKKVETFYGTQSLHAVLERCTWHAAQHVRQLMMVLEMHDIVPEIPLTEADLAGLPLPHDVWDG